MECIFKHISLPHLLSSFFSESKWISMNLFVPANLPSSIEDIETDFNLEICYHETIFPNDLLFVGNQAVTML